MSIFTAVYTKAIVALSQTATANPTPTPGPIPGYVGNEDLITPTWVGFLMTFLVALATLLLVVDMTRRIRRTRYRGEIREKLAAEAEAAEAAESEAAEAANRATGERGADSR